MSSNAVRPPSHSGNASTRSGSGGDAGAQADVTSQLHLWQVLREEFETHRPPGAEVSSTPAHEAARDLMHVRQPRLDTSDFDNVERAAEAELKAEAAERAADPSAVTGETEKHVKAVAGFFRLLARKQKEAAEATFNALRDSYRARLRKSPSGLESDSEGFTPADDRLAERLAAEEISGTLEDFRAQRKKERLRRERLGEGGGGLRQARPSDGGGVGVQSPDGGAGDEPAKDTDAELSAFVKFLHADDQDKRSCPPGGAGAAESKPSGNGHPPAAPGDEDDDGVDPAREAAQARARSLRSALCLSGGGIRSATFNLGILQGLARHGLLEQFDYLSTVSGGGFIGGWLSAWLHRDGTRKVIQELSHAPRSPVSPSPKPVDHLRVYSNYLSPRVGLLSADTWALGTTVLRNLLLTWLVFVPFIVAALLLPRAWVAILTADYETGLIRYVSGFSLHIGVVAGWVAFIFAGTSLSDRPSNVHRKDAVKSQDSKFIIGCLLPGVISAAALSVYWVGRGREGHTPKEFVLFSLLLALVPWVVAAAWRVVVGGGGPKRHGGSKVFARLFFATALIGFAQVVSGLLLWAAATGFFLDPAASPEGMTFYAAFAVPAALVVLLIGCALIAGFTSTLVEDDHLEWWSRAGAWFLIVTMVWVGAHVLVLYGPYIFLEFGDSLRKLRSDGAWDLESIKSLGKVLTVVGGVVSGVISLAGGFSGKTPAHGEETQRAGAAGRLLGVLTGLLAPLFLAFLFILIALGTNWLLAPAAGWLGQNKLIASDHMALTAGTRWYTLAAVGAIVLLVGVVMGMLVNTNRFSLHFMWRNRIIRAYLGASNRGRRPNPFTGFDTADNLNMSELRPQPAGVALPGVRKGENVFKDEGAVDDRRKLFHVLNIALNLAGGDKLAWQDRKAESFTVSPLHAGSYWLGYRRSLAYGGDNGGISLGTSVAISGAFVSPNMGYMMTSPVVRFLMTLFNVRFGWWLGNPGPAGDSDSRAGRAVAVLRRLIGYRSGKPFEASSPLLSVRPIVNEALGRTDDQHPYVYLSDGGHFENLGLYEMVLRRCRFIVVSDASTDAAYSFDSLAQSIRQIRVDLGVPIEMRDVSITPPAQGLMGKYCAVGKIRYSCVDRRGGDEGMKDGDFDGTLIYVKASMVGEEPRDVINYGRGSKDFPQEIIVDQWFSEAQFESYRALGSHIIDAICSGDERDIDDQQQLTLAAFERKAREHNRLNFRAFKGRIDYSALASQFRRTLQTEGSARYKRRVRRFMKEMLG